MQTIKTIDKFYYRELGKKMRKRRENLNMTLQELSQATGISRSQLDHYELGLNKIKEKHWNNICNALDINSSIKVEVTIGYWE